MSETIPPGKDGGPAFPETRWSDEHRTEIQWSGMSLRDYFAAKAMHALMTDPVNAYKTSDKLAQASYIVADAMIEEIQKK